MAPMESAVLTWAAVPLGQIRDKSNRSTTGDKFRRLRRKTKNKRKRKARYENIAVPVTNTPDTFVNNFTTSSLVNGRVRPVWHARRVQLALRLYDSKVEGRLALHDSKAVELLHMKQYTESHVLSRLLYACCRQKKRRNT